MPFYETKPHPGRESALNQALAIYRNPGWGLKVLFIEQWATIRASHRRMRRFPFASMPRATRPRPPGGSAVAGIQIGESIRLKGFTTVVAGNARCASACAIAWLGGTPRLMSAEARVGFHAAYSSETGQETGVGNALVGAYLNKIGLSYSAVIFITQAAPNSMTWLSIADAGKRGIDVEPLGSGQIAHMPSHGQIIQSPETPPTPRNGPLSWAEKAAINLECSNQANARGLHGSERQAFRAGCKRNRGAPQ
jgi:hypothetical protein